MVLFTPISLISWQRKRSATATSVGREISFPLDGGREKSMCVCIMGKAKDKLFREWFFLTASQQQRFVDYLLVPIEWESNHHAPCVIADGDGFDDDDDAKMMMTPSSSRALMLAAASRIIQECIGEKNTSARQEMRRKPIHSYGSPEKLCAREDRNKWAMMGGEENFTEFISKQHLPSSHTIGALQSTTDLSVN